MKIKKGATVEVAPPAALTGGEAGGGALRGR